MRNNTAQIKAALIADLCAVLNMLLPNGFMRSGKYYVGDVNGNKGESLVVEASGTKAGVWYDFATGDGGDIIELWAEVKGFSKDGFPELIKDIQNWLGDPIATPERSSTVQYTPHKPLGEPTARWNYTDIHGNIIATISRYDMDGKKQFRPWDAILRRNKAPEIRPLYNLHRIKNAQKIILVEGEKCADALIKQGLPATTAMNGANAPTDKTDWSPLAGKQIILWPDNDEIGKSFADKVASHLKGIGLLSISILKIPPEKPEKWDAADAIIDGMNVRNFIQYSPKTYITRKIIPSYNSAHILSDTSPMPEDIIAPRVLTAEGMLVFGGAPKVGKSDFLMSFMMHMAAGIPFLGMTPPRPLRVFYLQAEIGYHYLRERLQKVLIEKEQLSIAGKNFVITPQIKMVLDEQTIQQAADTINAQSWDGKVDIIVIDPLRNVFDGNDAGENDNTAMLAFLRNRLEILREKTNPQAGLIIAHHTRKITKKILEEDPFQALSGAGSLRGYYTSGIIMHRPDEHQSPAQLFFELRNGKKIPPQMIDKTDAGWQILPTANGENYPQNNLITSLLISEAEQGRVYTSAAFAREFEGKHNLGSQRTINEKITKQANQGVIHFFKNYADYSLPPANRSPFGYMSVKGMKLLNEVGALCDVKPTHKRCSFTGNCIIFNGGHAHD